MRRRVLIGTDGSEPSRRAARVAVELVGPDAEYVLARAITVTPAVSPTGRLAAGSLEPLREEAREEARIGLLRDAEAIDAPAAAVLVEGDPATELLRLADERQVDLIAVGSRGLGALRRAVLGSVSSRLVREAARPVLVVPC